MKVRRGNGNAKHPSLIVGLSPEFKEEMDIKIGDTLVWVRVAPKKWEIQKLEVD